MRSALVLTINYIVIQCVIYTIQDSNWGRAVLILETFVAAAITY